jgi:hypothetical protein
MRLGHVRTGASAASLSDAARRGPRTAASRANRRALYAAPIRATGVKRAYGPGPVTTRAAGLGSLFSWVLPRSCLVLSRRAGGVKLERPQPRSGEDERA